nr:hypothetical protein [Rhodoferax sp.]
MLAKCVVVLFAALSLVPSLAGAPGDAVPGVNHPTAELTREALGQCLLQEVELGKAMNELKAVRTGLDAAVKALDAQEAHMKSIRAKLDRTNQSLVDSYNAQVKAHRERIAIHNHSQQAFNVKASAYQANLLRYQSHCAGKSFRGSDREAVQPPKP